MKLTHSNRKEFIKNYLNITRDVQEEDDGGKISEEEMEAQDAHARLGTEIPDEMGEDWEE